MIATMLYLLVIVCTQLGLGCCSTWSEWWTYEGISGPDFWGLVNPEWNMCSKGKKQSPINIDPRTLLYDPSIKHLHVDKHRINGLLMNTGHDVRIVLDDPSPHLINISGGPLVYQYRICEIMFHFGSKDSVGSEHTIDGESFPAEIQIMGYNTDLYGNLTQATYSTNGLAIIGILTQIGSQPNSEFEIIAEELKQVRYKGDQVRIRHLSVHGLLPETQDYLTYEGSLTQPGCHETVSWVIMNKPMYISNEHMTILRDIMQGDSTNPKVPMENNGRPTCPVNTRPIRTNINFPTPSKGCSMEKKFYYQANMWGQS